MRILGIDPGTTQSGFVVWDDGVIEAAVVPNIELLARLIAHDFGSAEICGIEMVASFGMAVGKEVFETVFWIGRLYQESHKRMTTIRVFRKDIKIHICGTAKAKDANIRQALIDKHGAPGTKKAQGKTYGLAGHLWSAMAVCDFMEGMPSPRFSQPFTEEFKQLKEALK